VHKVGNIGPQRADLFLSPNANLPNFKKTPAVLESAKASFDKIAIKAVENNVNSLSLRKLQHLFGEIQRARIHHMLNAQRLQKTPLGGTSGCKDLGTCVSGELNSGLPDAARSRVNEHPLSCPHLRQAVQTEVGCKEDNGQRRRLCHTQVVHLW